MNNKKILAIMFMSIFLISLASALTFKQNEQADINIICINAGYCTASAICNASVFDPDNIVILDGVQATQSPSLAYHNITLNSTQTTKLGQYNVGGFCKDGSVTQVIDFNFEVTKIGKILETKESLIYFILAFGVLLLFILSFYFMIMTPYGNEIDDKGAVMKISKLKYVKIGLILLTWVLLTWFLNILIGLSDNFVSLTMYYGFFGFIFETMNNLALPLGIFLLVLSGFEIVKDTNIHKEISKFGSAK